MRTAAVPEVKGNLVGADLIISAPYAFASDFMPDMDSECEADSESIILLAPPNGLSKRGWGSFATRYQDDPFKDKDFVKQYRKLNAYRPIVLYFEWTDKGCIVWWCWRDQD